MKTSDIKCPCGGEYIVIGRSLNGKEIILQCLECGQEEVETKKDEMEK